MSKKDVYEVVDLEKFIDSIRVVVFDSLGPQNITKNKPRLAIEELNKIELEELNNILSHKEASNILKEYVKEITKKNKKVYYIEYDDYNLCLESLTQRMFSNVLVSLTNKGLIETAFDEEKNDFVFWIK